MTADTAGAPAPSAWSSRSTASPCGSPRARRSSTPAGAAGKDVPTLCQGDTLTPEERLPRLRRRGRGRPHARPGLLAQGRAGHGGAHRHRARPAQPQDRPRTARLLRRPVDHAAGRRVDQGVRGEAGPVRRGRGHGSTRSRRSTTTSTSATTTSASSATSASTPAATSGRTPSPSPSPGAASTPGSPSSTTRRSPTPPASTAATASRCARRARCRFKSEFDMREAGTWDEERADARRRRSARTAVWAATSPCTCRTMRSSRSPRRTTTR